MPAKRTIFLIINGVQKSIQDCVRESGIPEATILSRINRLGWSHTEAVSTPPDKRFSNRGPSPRKQRPVPTLRESSDGRACCRWTVDRRRHVVYFGPWGNPETIAAYSRWAAQWKADGGSAPVAHGADVLVFELIDRYLTWSEGYYIKNGKVTSEVGSCRAAFRPLAKLYGSELATEFGPNKLRSVQSQYVEHGYSRQTCNEHLQRVVKLFSWGAGREIVPASIPDALKHVERLVAGRTIAPDNERIPAAPIDDVLATIPHLHPVAAKRELLEVMVRVQMLSRMRPGELIAMRADSIDRAKTPWRYEVAGPKTLHLDKRRLVLFGPEARRLLAPILAASKTAGHLWCFPGRPQPITVSVYTRLIAAACQKASVPVWTPRQLRKTGATFVQRRYESDEAVAIALGNTPEVARQVYVDDPSEAAAVRIAEATG